MAKLDSNSDQDAIVDKLAKVHDGLIMANWFCVARLSD